MSRFLKIMIVLLTIAAVATPVLAEDRLSLSGQMRVRGWHIDADANDYTNTWADQRLRIAGKFSVAEGVSVTFRFDATEQNWGSQPGFGGGRLVNSDASMQWDRAHLDVEKGMYHLRAGQQWIGFGKSGFDAQDSGLLLNIKAPVTVSLFYMLDDDNNAPKTVMGPAGAGDNSDAHYYGVQIGHKGNNYNSNVFAAGQKDGDEDVYVIGATYATNLDVVALYAELEYFTGDYTATQDAYGFQAHLDASMAATDVVKVGAQLYYALGDDQDRQYVRLGNGFNGWDPLFELGTGLDNEQIGLGSPYTVLGNGAGVIAGRLYTSVKTTDALTLSGSFTYAVAEEDDLYVDESLWAVAAGLSYRFMPNTSFGAQVEYIDFDETDEVLKGGVGLFVNF